MLLLHDSIRNGIFLLAWNKYSEIFILCEPPNCGILQYIYCGFELVVFSYL